ncbi:hypothetical protein V3C99_017920, partial [Haemonchus contortus]
RIEKTTSTKSGSHFSFTR